MAEARLPYRIRNNQRELPAVTRLTRITFCSIILLFCSSCRHAVLGVSNRMTCLNSALTPPSEHILNLKTPTVPVADT